MLVGRILTLLPLLAFLEPSPAAGDPTGAAGEACHQRVAAGEDEAALAVCREALLDDPSSPPLRRTVARLEFVAGDARRSAELYGGLLASEGWSAELALSYADALWRAGRIAAAEAALVELLRRQPTAEGHLTAARFYSAFGRWDDAARVASEGAGHSAASCELLVVWGAALAGLGDHREAAQRFAAADALPGCPPFAWVGAGELPLLLQRPEYEALLNPEALLRQLAAADEGSVLQRLELLRTRVRPVDAPALVEVALDGRSPTIQLAALGVLAELGGETAAAWRPLLASEDFVLRKQVLRQLRALADPRFAPLLADQLAREETPGNRSLVRLALGELRLAAGEVAEGRALLLAIPAGDALRPAALIALAEEAERQGRHGEALDWVEAAADDPQLAFVDAERLQRLRRSAALEAREVGAGEPFALAFGERATLAGSERRVRFVELLEDSRCPAGATCIQAGRVRVQLAVQRADGEPTAVELGDEEGSRRASAGGLELELLAVEPTPRSGEATPAADYVVTLVARVGN
jgi:hypothetical protein